MIQNRVLTLPKASDQARSDRQGHQRKAHAEVNPVIRALRSNGIEVTALHSHMLTEQPRLLFMHFWANDDALKLAQGLRAAIDTAGSVTSQKPPG